MSDGSALLKIIEHACSSDDDDIKKLGEAAQGELYTILEMDTNVVLDHDARLSKEVRDYFYHECDHAGVVGFMLAAEICMPNGMTNLATRYGGSMMMPWNRMGMLQFITNNDMQNTLGGEDVGD